MIMNNKKSVFGVVENIEVDKDYTGVETSTAKVTVNNDTREIKVDVDFQGMLGLTTGKAYPAVYGVQDRHDILELKEEVDDEIKRSKDTDYELEQSVSAETKRAKQSEELLQSNIDKMSSVVESKIDALDNKVSNNIQQSIDSLSAKDAELQTAIDTIEEDYAKKTEIPDVSAFIAEIPEEYITETELSDKGYYNSSDIISLLNNIEFIDGGTAPS